MYRITHPTHPPFPLRLAQGAPNHVITNHVNPSLDRGPRSTSTRLAPDRELIESDQWRFKEWLFESRR